MSKTHKVTDEFVHSAWDNACDEWKLKIEEAIPEFKPKCKFKAGVWYYAESMRYTYLICSDGKKGGYGFFDGRWGDIWGFGSGINYKVLREATREEIQSALEKEAKRRGFKERVKYKSLTNHKHTLVHDGTKYFEFDKSLCVGGWEVFKDGKWAEVIKEPEESVDWADYFESVKYDEKFAYAMREHILRTWPKGKEKIDKEQTIDEKIEDIVRKVLSEVKK